MRCSRSALLGYPDDHRLIARPDQGDRGARDRGGDRVPPAAVRLPGLGHRARRQRARRVRRAAPTTRRSVRAADWLIDRQVTEPGDWQVKRPGSRAGGWAFQFDNAYYPDLDDTAMVVMGLHEVDDEDPTGEPRRDRPRAVAWLRGMQGKDGGWASFDTDQTRLLFNNIPFADHGALLDPATEDLTARCVECFGRLGDARGRSRDRARASRSSAARRPRGRVARPLGRELPVRHVVGAARARGDRRSVRRIRWSSGRSAGSRRRQNPDGGWGETCDSYADPHLKGRGRLDSEPDGLGRSSG